jgi:hypothetical protein
VIHIIWTVENDTLFCKSLRKIFRRFSFACSCGTGGCAAKIQLKGSHKRHVTLVSKRSDNKTACITKILIAVGENGSNALTPTLILLLVVFVPVVSKLWYPLELILVLDVVIYQVSYNVLCMNINNDKCIDRYFSKVAKLLSNKVYSALKLSLELLVVLFNSRVALSIEGSLNVFSPVNLRSV